MAYQPDDESIGSMSFYDDFIDIEKRIPSKDPQAIARWVAVTNSFLTTLRADPTHHSTHTDYSKLDPIFDSEAKQKEWNEAQEGTGNEWDADIQKAVSGDIQNSIAKMKRWADIEISDGSRKSTDEDTVTVTLPPKLGPIVVKNDDGRVWMIDEEGEYDSGELKPPEGESVARLVKTASRAGDLGYGKSLPSSRVASSKPHTTVRKTSNEQKMGMMSPADGFMSGGTGWAFPATPSNTSLAPAKKLSSLGKVSGASIGQPSRGSSFEAVAIDKRSSRTRSSYKAPTVEAAFESPEKEGTQLVWDAEWGDNEQRGSARSGSKKNWGESNPAGGQDVEW